ncbi:MAG: hypothetical protein QM762_13840 [Chryseolinea sp.]
MSWDVIVFNLNRKVDSVEEIDETVLVDIGTKVEFKKLIETNYPDVIWDNGWGKIEKHDYSIEFSLGDSDEPFSNTLFHLYGENAIYDLIEFCKKNKWQAFDTGLDQMLDLQKPENNGYKHHQEYLKQ